MGLSRVELAAVAVILLSRGCVTSATGGRTRLDRQRRPAPRRERYFHDAYLRDAGGLCLRHTLVHRELGGVAGEAHAASHRHHPSGALGNAHLHGRCPRRRGKPVGDSPRRAATSSVLASLPTTSRRLRRTPPDTATPISTSDWLSTSLLIGPPRIAMVARVRSKRVWILCRLTDSARICW
jgi:hypothetical protein